jgi:hypothetical protein
MYSQNGTYKIQDGSSSVNDGLPIATILAILLFPASLLGLVLTRSIERGIAFSLNAHE